MHKVISDIRLLCQNNEREAIRARLNVLYESKPLLLQVTDFLKEIETHHPFRRIPFSTQKVYNTTLGEALKRLGEFTAFADQAEQGFFGPLPDKPPFLMEEHPSKHVQYSPNNNDGKILFAVNKGWRLNPTANYPINIPIPLMLQYIETDKRFPEKTRARATQLANQLVNVGLHNPGNHWDDPLSKARYDIQKAHACLWDDFKELNDEQKLLLQTEARRQLTDAPAQKNNAIPTSNSIELDESGDLLELPSTTHNKILKMDSSHKNETTIAASIIPLSQTEQKKLDRKLRKAVTKLYYHSDASGRAQEIESLIEHGANLDQRDETPYNIPLVCFAVMAERPDIVKLFLAKEPALVHTRDNAFGNGLLHYLSKKPSSSWNPFNKLQLIQRKHTIKDEKNSEIAEGLIAAGIDVMQKNYAGETALDLPLPENVKALITNANNMKAAEKGSLIDYISDKGAAAGKRFVHEIKPGAINPEELKAKKTHMTREL